MNIFNLIAAPIDWFMNDFFYWSLNAGISASFLVLAIILLRLIFKKAPKALFAALWGLVAIRLICPFSIESALSLIPSAETIPNEAIFSDDNQHDNFTLDVITNPNYPQTVTQEFQAPVGSVGYDLIQLEFLWLAGIAAMLLYAVISYILIHRKTKPSIRLRENIFLCDNIETPFILGVIRPRIYIPSYMNEDDMTYVIAHEKAHLKRKDQLWKPLGFVLLSLYWINPVMWIAYILLCKDIELACDEKVIKELGIDIKKQYSQALINCSAPRKVIAACPLAFGEVGVKDRIKTVLSYKKPAFWVIIVAVILSIAVAICFMTNPISVNYDRIMAEKGFTITAQERVMICLSIPLDKLPADLSRKHSFSKNNIVLYDDESSKIYLETIMPANSSTEKDIRHYLFFNISHKPKAAGDILSTVYKSSDGFYSGKILAQNSVTDSKEVYENAIDLMSQGPDNQFGIYIESDVLENAQDMLNITVYLSKIHYTNDNSYKNHYISIQESGSTADGVSVAVNNILTTGDEPYISIRWENQTDTDLTFGEEFYLYRYVNGRWLDNRATEEYYLDAVAWLLPAQNFVFKEYSLADFDIPKAGLYRFESSIIVNGKKEKVWVDFELNNKEDNPLGLPTKENETSINKPDYSIYNSNKTTSKSADPEHETTLITPKPTETNPVKPHNYPKTAVAFTGSNTLHGGLNADKLYISSVQHLPIYKFESRKEIERFIVTNGDKISLDSGWDEIPSVKTVLAQYDEAFFEENVLFAVFVQCADCTHRFAIDNVYNDGTNFTIHVKQTNHPQMVAEMVAGWMLTYTAKKEDIKTCTQFDADLNSSTPLVTSIEDLTVKEHMTTDSALQPFYEDDKYVYSYPSIRSDYVIVTFADGTQMTAEEALKRGYISISDLDYWHISYFKQEKN